MLVAATGLAIESVREILTPHHGPAPFTLAILIVVIVVKEFLFRYVNRLGRQAESTAVKTDAWHHRSDALTSTAAFIGISVALLGGEAWYSADDWAALFACAVIAANGVRLALPAFYEIMDTAPGGKIVRSIRAVASSVPGVVEVEKCHARKMGLDYYVDLHVGVDGNISVHRRPRDCTSSEGGDSTKRLAHRRRSRPHRTGTTVAASGEVLVGRFTRTALAMRSMAATCLDALHNRIQRARENFSCTRDSPRELNQARDAPRMDEEKSGEHCDVSSLLLDIKQDARRSREWLGWRICNDAERQQRNAVSRAGAAQ